jgi:hypothetical protein
MAPETFASTNRARCLKKLAILALVVLSETACAWRSVPTSENWLIESYSYGTLTVQHEGSEYTATCDFGASFNPEISGKPNDWKYSPGRCDTTAGLVKREIQPFDGRRRDENGRIVNMWTVGDTLALRSWENERSPWRQEHFKVTSVTPQRLAD